MSERDDLTGRTVLGTVNQNLRHISLTPLGAFSVTDFSLMISTVRN